MAQFSKNICLICSEQVPLSLGVSAAGCSHRRAGVLPRLRTAGLALIGAALLVLGSGTAQAVPPDQTSIDIAAALAELARVEATPEGLEMTAAELIASADLPGLITRSGEDPAYGPMLWPIAEEVRKPPRVFRMPTVAVEGGAAPVAVTTNLKAAMTIFSSAKDFEDNGVVLKAQPGDLPMALALESGKVDLATLARLMSQQGLKPEYSGNTLTINAALVIWPGATLVIQPGEELVLSRINGAFILNFGTLEVNDGAISSVGERNKDIRRFRPFITTVDSGSLILRGAKISGLGFGKTEKFSGLAVWRRSYQGTTGDIVIENTLIQDVISVDIRGAIAPRIVGSRFRDMRGAALVIGTTQDAVISGNLFSGLNPGNSIRLEGASGNATLSGNVLLGGDYAGIVVSSDSTGATVQGNVVWKRGGSGIHVRDSSCALVTHNLVIGNDQKGIEVRRAYNAVVRENNVLDNNNAALWVSDQRHGSETTLENNVVAFNGTGVETARPGTLILRGNDLTRQFLEFVSGDMVQSANLVAADIHGREEIILAGQTYGVAPDPTKAEAITCAR